MNAKRTPLRGTEGEPVKLQARLPADLHAELVAEAEADERSLNSQMIVLLREALAARHKRR